MGQLYGKTQYILNIPTLYDFFNTFVRMSTEMNFHVFFVSLDSEQGNVYLSEQGIEYETDFDLWQNIMALLIFAAFFLILTYIRLLTMNKLR